MRQWCFAGFVLGILLNNLSFVFFLLALKRANRHLPESQRMGLRYGSFVNWSTVKRVYNLNHPDSRLYSYALRINIVSGLLMGVAMVVLIRELIG